MFFLSIPVVFVAQNSLVEREIVVTELRAAAAEKERALEALQSQLLLQQEEAREWQVIE